LLDGLINNTIYYYKVVSYVNDSYYNISDIYNFTTLQNEVEILLANATVQDDFNRDDSSTIGTASNGNTWTDTGTLWQILNNSLYTTGETNTAMLELSHINPLRIDYQIYTSVLDTFYQRFGDNSGVGLDNYAILMVINTGTLKYYDGGWLNFPTTFTPSTNTWYNISLRNINYTSHTYNLYVDDVDYGSADFTTDIISITHIDFDKRDSSAQIDCITINGAICSNETISENNNITLSNIINTSITNESTIINWNTNLNSNSSVVYGLISDNFNAI
jgi:hypothetical protein